MPLAAGTRLGVFEILASAVARQNRTCCTWMRIQPNG